MKKIGLKILMIHLIFVCVSVSLALFISYRTVNSILLEHASSLGTACAELEAKEIDSWLKEKLTLLESVAVQIENGESNDEAYIQKILENAAKADPSFYSFFIGFENGRLMDANGWVPPADYNTVERPWYREAIDANRIIFTSAYIDKKKNTRVKAIAIPLHAQGMNAVLAANIPFDTIRKQIQGIRFGKTGYGILVDGDGIILVHPEGNNEMKPLEEDQKDLNINIQENIRNTIKGTTLIRSGKKEELLVHVPIQSNDWVLLLLAPIEEFQGPAKKMAGRLIAAITFLMGLIIFISCLMGKKFSVSLKKALDDAERIADIESLTKGNEVNLKDDTGKTIGNEAFKRKEKHIAGTEEVYDIAGQIDEIAAQLEKGVRSFKI
ncbi:MAG: cache domain-containing protein [Caulobacteraceae bacterium]